MKKLKRRIQFVLLLPLVNSGGNGPRLPGTRVVSKFTRDIEDEDGSSTNSIEDKKSLHRYRSLQRTIIVGLFSLVIIIGVIFILFYLQQS